MEGTFFRLIAGALPTSADFNPSVIDSPGRRRWLNDCTPWGTSFFTSLQGARKVAQIPALRKKISAIAVGDLSPLPGKMLKTGRPGHFTCWIAVGVDPSGSFEVVETLKIDPSGSPQVVETVV